MKTTIEVNGHEIIIEENDGVISVSALKDGEVIEEFEISSDESELMGGERFEDEDEEEVQDFEDFEGQDEDEEDEDEDDSMPKSMKEDEEDFEEEDEDDDDKMNDMGEMSEDEGERKLESFNSFLKKRK
jgi:hypothetical protein